jgi:hypothetical protein
MFINVMRSYGKEFLATRLTPKLEDHPLLALRDCLFNTWFVNKVMGLIQYNSVFIFKLQTEFAPLPPSK